MSYYFIYKRPDNSYYFKLKGLTYLWLHPIGYKNQYQHEIVLIIPINSSIFKFKENFIYSKKRIKRKIIKWLEKI